MGYSWIIPRLAQGSVPTGASLGHNFHTVVLAAEEWQDVPLFGVEVVKAPLDDAEPSPQDLKTAHAAARVVVDRWRRGRHVLVTCAQGRNRSGFIVAMALMMLGMDDGRAVRLIRAARGSTALSNKHFVRVLAAVQVKRGSAA